MDTRSENLKVHRTRGVAADWVRLARVACCALVASASALLNAAHVYGQTAMESGAGGVVATMRRELDTSREMFTSPAEPEAKRTASLGAIVADARAELWNVALISGGRVIGRGIGATSRAALQRAAADARAHLPAANDALQESEQVKKVREALLSVEVARGRMPLEIVTYFDAESVVRAGLEGLAVVPAADVKDGKVVVVFPSDMLAMGKTVPQSLVAAISEASGDAALAMPGIPGHEAGDLIKAGWKFERFRVEHQVELVRGRTAMSLTRGGRVIEEREITQKELKRWRDGIAQHLDNRARVDEHNESSLVSDYMPSLDRDGANADELEQALVNWARWKQFMIPTQLEPRNAPSTREEYVSWAERDIPAAAARCLAAFPRRGTLAVTVPGALKKSGVKGLDEGVGSGAELTDMRVEVDGMVVRRAYCVHHGWDARIPEAARGIAALALVRMLSEQQLRDERSEAGVQARGAVQSLLASGQPGTLVRYMPWLGWAAVELSPPEWQADGSIKWPELGCAPVLREMRGMIWEKQIDLATAQAEGLDLKGAILFGQGVEARRQIGWQTARPVAFAATMLRDPRLTSTEERNAEIMRLVAGMRFLRQLTLDETSTWRTPRADRAMYGVRNAPWDQRQSLEASVMTLLAVEEMIGSLE